MMGGAQQPHSGMMSSYSGAPQQGMSRGYPPQAGGQPNAPPGAGYNPQYQQQQQYQVCLKIMMLLSRLLLSNLTATSVNYVPGTWGNFMLVTNVTSITQYCNTFTQYLNSWGFFT